MRLLTISPKTRFALMALGTGMLGVVAAPAQDLDFSNPGVTLAGRAVIASGTCIAKYTRLLDDAAQPAEAVGKQVAKRCQKEITRSAGLAAWLAGKPEDFDRNLRYARDDLTTGTVVRHRGSPQNAQLAQDR